MTEEEFDVTDLKKKIMHVFEENQKLEFTKKQHKELAEELYTLSKEVKKFSDKLELMGNKLYPNVNITVRSGNKDYTSIFDELYELMKNGTQITNMLISKTYSNLNFKSVAYIMLKLQKMPNVKKVKDGKHVRLYI